MKRALLLLSSLVLGAACTDLSAKEPRRYQCDPLNTAPQCPGGWQCTLDGFCADPDAGLEMSCFENSDCTGGWLCTQTGRCVDPRVGRPLPCNDNTECPGQWKCGLINQCLDPDAGAPWPCVTADDCTGGWNCGLQGVCYDRLVAEDIECERDAGFEYCAPLWRCGLDERCHDTRVGAPLPCERDDDCEQQWRCSVTGQCANAAADGLEPIGGLDASVVFPTWVPATSELVAINKSNYRSHRDVAVWGAGTLTVAQFSSANSPIELPDGGEVAGVVETMSVSAVSALEFATRGEFDGGRNTDTARLWLSRAVDGGALTEFWEFTPGVQPVLRGSVATPFVPTRLRNLPGGWLAGFNDTRLFERSPAGAVTMPTPPGGAITDVTVLQHPFSDSNGVTDALPDSEVVVTRLGVFARPWSFTGPAAVPWTRVGLKLTGQRLTRFFGDYRPQVLLEQDLADGGVSVSFGATGLGPPALEPDAGFLGSINPDNALSVVMTSSFNLSALENAWFVSLGDGGTTAVGLGRGPEGERGLQVQASGRFVPLPDDLKASDGPFNDYALVGGGRVLVRDEDDGLALVPLVPSEPPGEVLGTARQPYFSMLGRPINPSGCTINGSGCEPIISPSTCRSGHTPWLWCQADFNLEFVTVAGRDDWLLARFPVVGQGIKYMVVKVDVASGHLVSSVGYSSLELGALGAATAFDREPDGGTLLLVGSTDRLNWGISSAATSSTMSAPYGTDILRFATTPFPGGRVTSISVRAPEEPDARFALGYLISSGRLFRFAADNEVVWRTMEVVVSAGEAVRTWTDRGRSRVLMRDGSLFGLPSQVRLVPPLSAGASSVIDSASACGQTFALSGAGLFRVSGPDAQGNGAWVPVSLLNPSRLGEGKLVATQDSSNAGTLLVLLPDGRNQRVPFECAP